MQLFGCKHDKRGTRLAIIPPSPRRPFVHSAAATLAILHYSKYASPILVARKCSTFRDLLASIRVRGISIRPFPGLVNFVPAVAYLFSQLACSILPTAYQPLFPALYFSSTA